MKFQSDICSVSYCISNWNLPFNDTKFNHMRFWKSFHYNHPEYTIKNKLIEQKSFHKDLDITFTNNINWTKYIISICAKAYQTLGLLQRTFKTNCVKAKNIFGALPSAILFSTMAPAIIKRHSIPGMYTVQSQKIYSEQLQSSS